MGGNGMVRSRRCLVRQLLWSALVLTLEIPFGVTLAFRPLFTVRHKQNKQVLQQDFRHKGRRKAEQGHDPLIRGVRRHPKAGCEEEGARAPRTSLPYRSHCRSILHIGSGSELRAKL